MAACRLTVALSASMRAVAAVRLGGQVAQPGGDLLVVGVFAGVQGGDPFGVAGELDQRGGEPVIAGSGGHPCSVSSSHGYRPPLPLLTPAGVAGPAGSSG